MANGIHTMSSSPCLWVSAAGNFLGSGLLSRFSIDFTLPVPQASVENTLMQPLNPTVQLIGPSIRMLASCGTDNLSDCWIVTKESWFYVN